MQGRGEMTHQGLAQGQGEPAAAFGLVDPVRAAADRALPLERCSAMAAPGRAGFSSHRADLGDARTVATPQLLVGAVDWRQDWLRWVPTREPPSHRHRGHPASGRRGRSAGRLAPSRSPAPWLPRRARRGFPGQDGSNPGGQSPRRRRSSPRPPAPGSDRTWHGPWTT